MSGKIKGIVIAGASSGAGKTTIATGIMGALARRGLRVQPFKAGPDYIDPSYHSVVTGRSSRNLDTWMLPRNTVIELFNRTSSNADISVVEGVMGLYDGHSVSNETGSTAELAKLLGLPVLLILDASGTARSLGAMALGYNSYDPDLNLAGIILNGIGSERHYQMCCEAVTSTTGLTVTGYLPKRRDFVLPERHLGLVPMAETPAAREFFDKLTDQTELTIDLEKIINLAGKTVEQKAMTVLFPEEKQPEQVRIALARDKAFSFYYEDSLDLLKAWGAEMVPFSPLSDNSLPENINGLYLGGGFPEIYAGELAENTPMLTSIRQAIERGLPAYAECGGLMYLGRSVRDLEGSNFSMAGALSIASCIQDTRLTLGYRTVRALLDNPVLAQDEETRGHEFHWSRIDREPQGEEAAYLVREENRREGFLWKNLLASYIHLHFAGKQGMAQRFISFCTNNRRGINCKL